MNDDVINEEAEELIPVEVEKLADSAIAFMTALRDAYGADAGISLFNQFRQVLGTDVQQIIFNEMLGIDNNRTKTVRFVGMATDKISFIKALRVATQVVGAPGTTTPTLGLKEAKDLADDSSNGHQRSIVCASTDHAQALRLALRSLGVTVSR
jgi:ribosomal protein L7/L12